MAEPENPLVDRASKAIAGEAPIPPGATVVVAVSGGLDSVVLLHVLRRLATVGEWALRVAHFNHRLRGPESDADERWVRRLADRLGVEVVVGREPVRERAREWKLSIETAARHLRHEFLARVAIERDGSLVALAHHADDQVETCFLRLLRGAGGDGLAGMRPCSPSPADPGVRLIRPFLSIPRDDLRQFAAAEGIRWREDSSNRDLDPLRNRLRLRVLPLLKRWFHAALPQTVGRTMEVIGAEADFVAEAASLWQAGGRGDFSSLHLAVQRRVIRDQLVRMGVTPRFAAVEALRLAPGAVVNVDEGVRLRMNQAGAIAMVPNSPDVFDRSETIVALGKGPGRVGFGGVEIEWRRRQRLGGGLKQASTATGQEYIDADAVGEAVTLRHWRPGDRFQPIGLGGSAKLQDLFVNARVAPAVRRGLILAVTAGGEIFWVEGLRIGEVARVTEGTSRILEWRWQRPPTTVLVASVALGVGDPGRKAKSGRAPTLLQGLDSDANFARKLTCDG